MSPEEALTAAKAILAKRAGQLEFKVEVDSPGDCTKSIKAFKSLGCRVKLDKGETILTVTPPVAGK